MRKLNIKHKAITWEEYKRDLKDVMNIYVDMFDKERRSLTSKHLKQEMAFKKEKSKEKDKMKEKQKRELEGKSGEDKERIKEKHKKEKENFKNFWGKKKKDFLLKNQQERIKLRQNQKMRKEKKKEELKKKVKK